MYHHTIILSFSYTAILFTYYTIIIYNARIQICDSSIDEKRGVSQEGQVRVPIHPGNSYSTTNSIMPVVPSFGGVPKFWKLGVGMKCGLRV